MKHASLIAAAAIVVVANAITLAHVARNRAGTPEAELTLTQRELRYFDRSSSDDNSGVTLHLNWTDSTTYPALSQLEQPPVWLDQQKLQTLGFDCSVNPSGPDAWQRYQRQRPRQAFIALEYDGPAWRTWLEARQRAFAEQRAQMRLNNLPDNSDNFSHLVPIDADLDSRTLRARHPDRTTVVILPAVIAVTVDHFPAAGMKPDLDHPARVVGRIRQLPSSIHVPRLFSSDFRRRNPRSDMASRDDRTYRVHLRYGSSLEPWVTGVEFSASH